MKFFFLLYFSLLLTFSIFGQTTHLVPSQYSTIQNAINSASNGDTVLISQGIYNEAINFSGKDIIVASEFINNQDTSYISSTIIDGTGLVNQDIVSINSGENNALLYGLSIKNGNFTNMGRSGIVVSQNSQVTLDYLVIEDIFSDGQGPGIFINLNSNVDIRNSIIRNNTSAINGGGIYIESSVVHIDSTEIINNVATVAGSGHGGGISIWNNSQVTIEHSLIRNNSSHTGAGIYVANSEINLIYNDISLNTAQNDGGGLTLSAYNGGPHSAIITNCTFYDNAAISNPFTSNGIKIASNGGYFITTILNSIIWENIDAVSNLNIQYSNIQQGTSGIGNISVVPDFVSINPLSPDYNLNSSSPCINAGNPLNTYNDPNGTRNDMGAYPYDACAGLTTSSTTDITTCDSYTWNDSIYTQSGTYSYSGTNSNLIYAENFSNGIGGEWSDNADMFYDHQDYGNIAGEYGLSESLTLSLNNMILGDSISISFDLLLFGTWDGSSAPNPVNSPDIFSLSANNNQLLNATFSNIDSQLPGWTYSLLQSYPDDFGQGTNPALTGSYYFADTFSASGCDNGTGICTGASNLSTCGGGGVSVYRINKTFYNNSTSINIEFSSNLGGTEIIANDGGCDEYWSIDNVEVSSLLSNNSLTNTAGCDSTAILNLIINNSVTTTNTITVCDGGSISVGTSIYDTIGSYIDTLQTANGCDSIINTVVDIMDVNITQNDTTICFGDSITLSIVDSSSSFYFQDFESLITNEWNYDSTIFYNNSNLLGNFNNNTILLNFHNLPQHDSVSIDFDLYILDSWDGNGDTESWSLSVDNIALINTNFHNLTVNSNASQAYPQNIPSNNPAQTGASLTGLPNYCWNWDSCCGFFVSSLYAIDKHIVHSSTNLEIEFEGIGLEQICDESWAIDNISVKLFNNGSIVSFNNNSILWSIGDTTESITVAPTQTTTYYLTQTQNGISCTDSVTVTVVDTSSSVTNITTCDSSYTWNGTAYTSSGQYTWIGVNSNGCDSTVTLNLTINYGNTVTTSVTACDTYLWNAQTITTSGNYNQTFTNVDGCDSVHTLIATINYSNTATTSVTACDTYLWNAQTITTSGNYNQTFTNVDGCDSVHTLVATINYSNTGTTSVTACDSYLWNTQTITSSGNYNQPFTNVAGCDSTHTLNVTIIFTTIIYDTVSICKGESYVVSNSTYNNSGDYTDTILNSNGCLSIIYTNLTVGSSLNSSITQVGSMLESTVNGGFMPYSYLWNTLATTEDINITSSGLYWLVVSDSLSCPVDTAYYNGELHTSISDIGISDLKVYPNPSRDIFNIVFSSNTIQNLDVRVINVFGEVIVSEELDQFLGEYSKQINLEKNAKGIYFLEIETNDGMVNKKLILQ